MDILKIDIYKRGMMSMNKIKSRLTILVLCFISVVSLMTVSISGEMKKIDSMSLDYKEKLIRFHV